MRFSNSNVLPTSFDCNGYVIGQRTESDQVADAIRSGGGRKLIGWRTEADRKNAEEQKQYSRRTCGYVQRLYIIIYSTFKGGVHLSQVHQPSKR